MTPQQEQRATALMIDSLRGDAAAYSDLLTLLAAVARQYSRNRVGDVPWLDDVAQEVLLTVHKARATYDVRRPFAPWFYAILSHRMIDVLRKQKRVGAREMGVDVLPEPVTETDTQRGGLHDIDSTALRSALDSLPPRQREVVSALKLRDESVKEVSERLGMSVSSVKVTAHRGYRALRRLLGGQNED
jgi:RNA polymerase sigma-70 factor (ECF subfamily)